MWSGHYELVDTKESRKRSELSPLLAESLQDIPFSFENSTGSSESYTSLKLQSDDSQDELDLGDLSSAGIIKHKNLSPELETQVEVESKSEVEVEIDISQTTTLSSIVEDTPLTTSETLLETPEEIESLVSEPTTIDNVIIEVLPQEENTPLHVENNPPQPSSHYILGHLKVFNKLFSRGNPRADVKTVDGVFSNLSAKPEVRRNLEETSSIISQDSDVFSLHSFRDDPDYDPGSEGQALPEYEVATQDPPPHFDSIHYLTPFLFDLTGSWSNNNDVGESSVVQAVCFLILIIIIVLFVLAQIATA